MIAELVVALIIGVFGGGGVVSFFHVRSNNNKTDAEATSTLVGAAGEMVEMYRSQLEELRAEVKSLKATVARLEVALERVEAERDQLKRGR